MERRATSFPIPTDAPTSSFSGNSSSGSFSFSTIIAIVVPIFVVLAILSILYRRRRRAKPPRPNIATTHPSAHAKQSQRWNKSRSYRPQPRPDGFGSFQQNFVSSGPWNSPTPSQPPPIHSPPYWGNTATDGAGFGGTWGPQSVQGGYNPYASHYDTPVQAPSLTRNPSTFIPHPQTSDAMASNNFVEETPRSGEMHGFGPTGSTPVNASQNQSSERMRIRLNEESRRGERGPPANTRQELSDEQTISLNGNLRAQPQPVATSQQPQTVSVQRNRIAMPIPDTSPHKGDVVLEWTPQSIPVPASQQAGPSSNQTESQPQDTPELLRLRERVQRLEATLVEREQSSNQRNDPDRPPAYDSLPTTAPPGGSGEGGLDQVGARI